MSFTKVNDIKPLTQGNAAPAVLYVLGCKIKDLRPLREMPLRTMALTPHMCPSNWMSVLQSITTLEHVYGSQEEIKARAEIDLKEFIRREQKGHYQ